MAVAEIIGAAVGVLLLVIVAYLLVGGTLSMAETVATAQKDLTHLQEARLGTSISISDKETPGTFLNFSVTNTGSEPITDLSQMDVFSYNTSKMYQHYTYVGLAEDTGEPNTWTIKKYENDIIHPSEFDPGVKIWIKVNLLPGTTPTNVQVTTANGISALSSI